MEGWLLTPAMEYLKVRNPFRAIATLLLRLLMALSGQRTR
jgi:hypothetical protein